MNTYSTSFGFGLPKSHWDTPHPSKTRTPSSILGVRRRPSHLDSPLRAVKRRRLSTDDPKKRRIEKNDNGFKFYWILDSPATKGAPSTSIDKHADSFPTREGNPLRELSRQEWKERSAQRHESHQTDMEILKHNQPSHTPSSDKPCENPSLLDVSFGQPLDDERTQSLEPILECPPTENCERNETKKSVLDSEQVNDNPGEHSANNTMQSHSNLQPHTVVSIGNGKVLPVVPRDSATKKRRKRDYSPSQIVCQGNKKYIRRHGKRTEKYVVHEVRRKKVKKLRKVMKKKKKKRPKLQKQVTRYPPVEIPNFPLVNFSKDRTFWSSKKEPHVAVSKFLTNLHVSWMAPLIETYGRDLPTNIFGFIPRCMKKCIVHLNKHVPAIAESCEIVLEDLEKIRNQKNKRKAASATSGNTQLKPHWYIDCLKSRRDNLRAYTDKLQAEVNGFEEMWKEIERPGFLEELFPQLRLELNFENSENEVEEEKEDPIFTDWVDEDDFDAIEIDMLFDELELEKKLQEKECGLESQEREVKELHELFGASSSAVTKLNRVVAQRPVSGSGGVPNDSEALVNPSVSMYSRPRGTGCSQSIVSGFIQALERAQDCDNMDVDI